MKKIKKFEKELKDINVHVVQEHNRRNTRLLSKEASIYFFIKNSQECVMNGHKGSFVPTNMVEIANELFSLNNVFVALTPSEYFFNEKGEYVGEYPSITNRSLDSRGIVEDVKKYLALGATVYLYTYFGITTDICKGQTEVEKDVKTYWWRMVTKKESK
jgi:hypothetical protein